MRRLGGGGTRAGPSDARSGRSLVAALQAVPTTGLPNEKWAEADEVLCECTVVAGLLQRRGQLLVVARAGELRVEAAEKDVIRDGRTRRRRHPGVI
jgi:hypothetical protein